MSTEISERIVPNPEKAEWEARREEIRSLYSEMCTLLERAYGSEWYLLVLNKICLINRHFQFVITMNHRKQYLAWCILIGGTTTFSESPKIDFEGVDSIITWMRDQIQNAKSILG